MAVLKECGTQSYREKANIREIIIVTSFNISKDYILNFAQRPIFQA